MSSYGLKFSDTAKLLWTFIVERIVQTAAGEEFSS